MPLMFCLASLSPSKHTLISHPWLWSVLVLFSNFVQAENLGAYSSFSASLDTVSRQVLSLASHTIHCFTNYSLFLKFSRVWALLGLLRDFTLASAASSSSGLSLALPPTPASATALFLVLALLHWSASTVFTLHTVLGHVEMRSILVIIVISSCCQQLGVEPEMANAMRGNVFCIWKCCTRIAGPIDQQDHAVSLPLPFGPVLPFAQDVLPWPSLKNSYIFKLQLRKTATLSLKPPKPSILTAKVNVISTSSECDLSVCFLQRDGLI